MRRPASLFVAAGVAVALFGVVLVMVALHGGEVTRLDAAASAAVAPFRTAWLLTVFLWLTTLGTGAALFGMAVTATGFLWADRRTELILPLWIAFAGAEASVWTAKYAVGRARPVFLPGIANAVSPAFPSAHAAVSAATLGFIAYAVARDCAGRRGGPWVAFGAAVLIVLIDLSRVVLGVHFATDVIGGVLLGGAWLLLALALAERMRRAQ